MAFKPAKVIPAEQTKIERDDWQIPPALFRQYHEDYRFTLDVCATSLNAVVPRFFDRETNGLTKSWLGERCWMHAPHSDPVPWVEKAAHENRRGVLVFGLLQVRTDTEWWQRLIFLPANVRVRYLVNPGWRLHGLPLAGQRKVDGPRGAWAVVEWHPMQRRKLITAGMLSMPWKGMP